MNKIILITAGVFFLNSCKKDRTCTCKDQETPPIDDIVVVYPEVKKKDAQIACDALHEHYSAANIKCSLD